MKLINVSPTLNLIFFCSILSSNSFITLLIRSGDSGQPCLTPAFILILLVNLPPTPITVVACLYMHMIPSIISSGTLFLYSTFLIESCVTVSKALARSRNTLVGLLSFSLIANYILRMLTFSNQPSTGTNPFCLPLVFISFLSLLFQILPYILIGRLPIVIGLQLPTCSLALIDL